jgi:hypothetical protein
MVPINMYPHEPRPVSSQQAKESVNRNVVAWPQVPLLCTCSRRTTAGYKVTGATRAQFPFINSHMLLEQLNNWPRIPVGCK